MFSVNDGAGVNGRKELKTFVFTKKTAEIKKKSAVLGKSGDLKKIVVFQKNSEKYFFLSFTPVPS